MNFALNLKYDTVSPVGTITQKQIKLARIPENAWTDIAAEIKWSNHSDGYVKIYLGSPGQTGQLIDLAGGYTYVGPTMSAQFNPSQPSFPAFRFGEYWFSWKADGTYAVNQRICDFDVLKIGNADMTINDFLFTYPTNPSGNVRGRFRL